MTEKPRLSSIVLSKEDVDGLYLSTYKFDVPIYTERVEDGVYYTINNRSKLFRLILELTKFFKCQADGLPSLDRLHVWNIATKCKKSSYYDVKIDVGLFENGEARRIDAGKYWFTDALHPSCDEKDYLRGITPTRVNAAKTIRNIPIGGSVTIPLRNTSERAIREAIRREHVNKRGKYTTRIKYECGEEGCTEVEFIVVHCQEKT